MADKDTDIIPAERFTPEPDDAGDKQGGPDTGSAVVPLMINGQYIKDLSFEAPKTPDIFSLIQSDAPTIQVDINVEAAPKGENLFEVILTVRAEAKMDEQLV